VISLQEVKDRGLRLVFHTHMDMDLLDWMFPELKKLFMINDNSYFGVRADAAKNPDKHPDDPKRLMRYIAHRTAYHVWWNTAAPMNYPNSMIFSWSDIMTAGREVHEDCLQRIMRWHSCEMTAEELDAAWNFTRGYIDVQRSKKLMF